ncbi:unnamed protein product [Urochloa decumbens]|uniref:Uncharacterized protein n=1 Tax=Urochloa decumbens TaxID=240449 RepID=A0ABC8WLF1_9POAL
MADCFPFPPEADDLHRRWLPREIHADIGIVDAETVPDVAAEAGVVGVEELAAQLAGILGGGGKACPLAPPPTKPAAVAAPRHGAQVCGLERSAVVSCAGTGAGGGGAAVSWPFVPYPPVHWQGASNLVNLGGVLDYYYCPPPCLVPPPANLRGGTGVFIPRTACTLPTAKGGMATRAWPGTGAGAGTGRPATGRKQEWQQNETTTTPPQKKPQEVVKATGAALHACSPRPELALPQDWSYR